MDGGLLISFEGIDGSGKSTQLARVAGRLRLAGIEPICIREPGGTALGERVRDLLLDPASGDIDPATEALLYAASRAELVATVIEPALAAGQVVLVDRYVDSSLAYQGAGRELGIDRILEVNLLATRGRLPHATILVEVDPAEATARRAATGEDADRLEQSGDAFFRRVHEAYQQLAARWPDRILRIDGSGEVEAVADRIEQALAPLLEPLRQEQRA